MTTYRQVKGYSVKSVAGDPANIKEGQIWYNSSAKQIKVTPEITAWASGGNLPAVVRVHGGCGIQTAALSWGGFGPPHNKTDTNEYNGSSWSSGGTLNNGTARFSCCVGTQTAGLTAGGLSTPTVYQNSTEEYNGTSWSSGNNLPAARGVGSVGGIGTQTSAVIAVGGSGIPTTADAATLKYDGTNWTGGGSMNTARTYTAGFGTQTAGLYAAGGPGTKANVEEYDGSSWTEIADVSVARRRLASSNNSPGSDGLGFAGYASTGLTASTEAWNGTSWSAKPNMSTARDSVGGGGSSTSSAIVFGGNTGSTVATTEEFSSEATTRSVDVS